ncbi:hypothetical protein HGG82_14960 [Marinomonas sp. M1K-6]|uniref:Uncharacterized protein n=1 Tax=Marinomonas profundi TaxID=2726122 RepID=A0A847RA35_9GAMM|nr:hypothetical protein [Marinomonas profundi]NLQ18906.1 hypothetical protein [Marinomonas profundi]UDV02841.1 hypothetical protein J8N69_14905 [Marinomonas profundi]
MSLKSSFCVTFVGAAAILASSHTLAYDDYCTPKLNKYLSNVQKTVDSKYVSQRQKDVAQKVLDRVKSSRDETGDCVLVDKLLP